MFFISSSSFFSESEWLRALEIALLLKFYKTVLRFLGLVDITLDCSRKAFRVLDSLV